MKKVIFYPGPIHLFWTTGIYYVNELSKYCEVTLVLEKATKEDEEKLNYLTENRLKKIHYIKHANKLKRHWIYKNTATKLVKEIKPDLVFTINDVCPFETYLLYHSKRNKAINICYQAGLMENSIKQYEKRVKSSSAIQIKLSFHVPLVIAKLLVEIRNLSKHYWHYYVAPIMVGHPAFIGISSLYLFKGQAGLRDGDFIIVFGEKEKNFCLQDGVPENKIVVIPHPICWKSNRDFKKKYFRYYLRENELAVSEDVITIFLDNLQPGINRETNRLIKKDEICETWKGIIELTSKKYPKCSVFIKPHPVQAIQDNGFIKYIKTPVKKLPNVKLVEANKNAIDCVVKSKVIISEISTILYTASLTFNNKIIISLDLNKKWSGDVYSDTNNITYITNIKDFENLDITNVKSRKLKEVNGAEKLRNLLFNSRKGKYEI